MSFANGAGVIRILRPKELVAPVAQANFGVSPEEVFSGNQCPDWFWEPAKATNYTPLTTADQRLDFRIYDCLSWFSVK